MKLGKAPGPRTQAEGPYLHSDHRQDLHGDPVKLVKAAPGSRLGEALVDVSTGLQKERRVRGGRGFQRLQEAGSYLSALLWHLTHA